MAEKTIQGKKCPKCASFVKDGLKVCPVCGFEWDRKTTRNQDHVGEGEVSRKTARDIKSKSKKIICGKCGTENADDFRFCKICKHPLKEDANPFLKPDDRFGKEKSLNIGIAFDWIHIPEGYSAERPLKLEDFSPYFNGATQWKGYAFFIFQKADGFEILVRKLNQNSESTLFRKCEQVFICESGKEFYLGAVKFKTLGEMKENNDLKTVVRMNKTILKGPGETDIKPFFKGIPRIKIMDFKTNKESAEITKKTLLGREWISTHFGLDTNELGKYGLSKEHLYLTPLPGGTWILEPLEAKPVYEEINEIPVILKKGEILRWSSPDWVGEFRIQVQSIEG